MIIGDFNIDLKEPNKQSVKKYNNILETFYLKQQIVKPTRMQKTLIYHIITNILEKLIHQNVVLADEICDQDLPYVILNIRKQKFEKRYKYIVMQNASTWQNIIKIFHRFIWVLSIHLMIQMINYTCWMN